MHTIRMRPDGRLDCRPEHATIILDYITRCQADARDVTPPYKLGDLLTGEVHRFTHYHVQVPSESQSSPGRVVHWEIRVKWHAPNPTMPHGWVEAGHYGHACPASEAGKPCKHLWLAVKVIADTYHGGAIPMVGRRLAAAPDPSPEPELEPWDRPEVDAGWYG